MGGKPAFGLFLSVTQNGCSDRHCVHEVREVRGAGWSRILQVSPGEEVTDTDFKD